MPGYIYSVAEAGSEVQREVVKGMSTALALADDFETRHDLPVAGRLLRVQFADPALHPRTVAVGRGRKVGKALLKLPSLLRTTLVARDEDGDGVDEDLDRHLDWHGSPCYIYSVHPIWPEVQSRECQGFQTVDQARSVHA